MVKFPELTLKSVQSKLDNLTLIEEVSNEVLDKLINSDLLKDSFHNPTAQLLYSNEREQLLKYKKIHKLGRFEITYKRVKGMSFGRCNPVGALGLFCIRREIRQTLAKPIYTDIDVDNCHPTILYQVCKKYGIECDNLEDYVENRDKYLKEVMDAYKVSRDDAKKLFIILLYFGGFEGWAEDCNIPDAVPTKNIKNFKRELQTIGKAIHENNPDISNEVKNNKELKGTKEYNEIGSVVSYYLQEIECRILEAIYLYCKSHNIISNDAVLCADGLMIKSERYNKKLLKEFKELINEKFGLDLNFSVKEMKQDYLDILDDHIQTEDRIIAKILKGYTIDIDINKDIDFNIKQLSDFFNNDIKELGEENYLKYFEYTNSFRYFNAFHAYFYMSDDIYKIYKSVITNYKNFEKSMENLFFMHNKIKYKFTSLYLQSDKRNTFSSFLFSPNDKSIGDKYNLFNGFFYENNTNTYDIEKVNIFIKHIEFICNEEGRKEKPISNYVLNWFSHIIQKPEVKTDVALVFYSIVEGVGKNKVSDIFSKLIKGYEAKFRDTSALTDKFNGDMMGKLFVVGDEINARAQEVANELKDIITRKTELIEFKGKDKFLIQDFKNYFFTTNNENVFKVSNSDRRFMFIESPEVKKPVEYYSNLVKFENDEECLRQLYNYLKSRDITEYKPLEIVMTAFKKRLIIANAPAYIRFVKDNLDWLKGKSWTTKQLYDDSIDYAKKNKLISSYTLHSFEIQFNKVFKEFSKKDKETNTRVYRFPNNDETNERINICIEDNYV
jgi:hypothetical protein